MTARGFCHKDSTVCFIFIVTTIVMMSESKYNAPKIVYAKPVAPLAKNSAAKTTKRTNSAYASVLAEPCRATSVLCLRESEIRRRKYKPNARNSPVSRMIFNHAGTVNPAQKLTSPPRGQNISTPVWRHDPVFRAFLYLELLA